MPPLSVDSTGILNQRLRRPGAARRVVLLPLAALLRRGRSASGGSGRPGPSAVVALDDRPRHVGARDLPLNASLARLGVDRDDVQRLAAQLRELVVELVSVRLLVHDPGAYGARRVTQS